jgi:putative salt-induced outer membrane protein
MQLNHDIGRCIVLAAAMMALGAGAQAQTPVDGKWHGGVSIGGAAASGNTSSTTLAANAEAVRATSMDKITVYGLGNYAKGKVNGVDTTTANLFRVGGRYDYNLTDRLFAFGGGESETNRAGGVDTRYALNGGVGYKLVRTDTMSWDVFGGLGYSDTEFTDGTQRNGAELLLGEESSHKLGESTTVKQRLVIYPGGSEVGTRATFDAGLATAISGGWTLNTGLSYRYASKVAVGLKKADTLWTVGFGYKF